MISCMIKFDARYPLSFLCFEDSDNWWYYINNITLCLHSCTHFEFFLWHLLMWTILPVEFVFVSFYLSIRRLVLILWRLKMAYLILLPQSVNECMWIIRFITARRSACERSSLWIELNSIKSFIKTIICL